MSNGKKIIIIDDDPNITEVYSAKLRNEGYEVETAPNAKSGEAKIAAGYVPDLIVLDIIMPGDNGIQLLERLGKNEALKDTKILIFSNLDQRADLDQKILDQIEDYCLKVNMIPSDLVKKIATILQ